MRFNLKKISAIVLSLAMVATTVFAGSWIAAKADGEMTVEVDFSDASSVVGNVATYSVGEPAATVTITSSIAISEKKANLGMDDELTIGGAFDPEHMEVMAYEPGGFSVPLAVVDNKTKLSARTSEGGYPSSIKIKIVPKGTPGGGEFGPGEEEPPFEGSIYLFWAGSNNQVCYHKLSGLEGYEIGVSEVTNYVDIASIKDDRNASEIFSLDKKHEWVTVGTFEKESTAGNIKPESLLNRLFDGSLSEDELHSVTVSPGATFTGKNSLTETPNNCVRITIKTPEYQGVGVAAEGKYKPEIFGDFFSGDAVDLSGTTADKPAEYKTYLLNDTVEFSDLGGVTVDGIKALNVPSGAVTITDNHKVKFNSNFYDKVVLEITTGGQKHYVKIARTAMKVDSDRNSVKVMFVYDDAHNYREYQVLANIVYKDGTSAIKTMKSSYVVDEFGNPTTDYEIGAGEGCKEAMYTLDWDDSNIQTAYFTVVKAGATNGPAYTGTVTGSGKGVHYDPASREMIF